MSEICFVCGKDGQLLVLSCCRQIKIHHNCLIRNEFPNKYCAKCGKYQQDLILMKIERQIKEIHRGLFPEFDRMFLDSLSSYQLYKVWYIYTRYIQKRNRGDSNDNIITDFLREKDERYVLEMIRMPSNPTRHSAILNIKNVAFLCVPFLQTFSDRIIAELLYIGVTSSQFKPFDDRIYSLAKTFFPENKLILFLNDYFLKLDDLSEENRNEIIQKIIDYEKGGGNIGPGTGFNRLIKI